MKQASSFIQGFLFEQLGIRGAIVHLGDAWQQLCQGRTYPAPVSTLLGQMCAVTIVIAGNLKHPGRLSFQIQGHGLVNILVVDCAKDLNLRAMARFSAAITTMTDSNVTLAQLLGDGKLQLTLELPDMNEPYFSLVPLEGESIAAIFSNFLNLSEQLSSSLHLACLGDSAGALFLQKLPDADQQDADGWSRITQLSHTLRDEELLQLSPQHLLTRLFSEEDVRLFDARPVIHHWPADRNKASTILLTLGEIEVRRMLAEQGSVTIEDELSNHFYRFDAAQIDALFAVNGKEDVVILPTATDLRH